MSNNEINNEHWSSESEMLVFWGEGKSEHQEKTSWCRVEKQQIQPTYDARFENQTRATSVGGECSHHCASPTPHVSSLIIMTFSESS